MLLQRLGCDIVKLVSEFLNGRDLIAFSRINKTFSSLVSEESWRKAFERDFGPQGLTARKVLLSRRPNVSWQATYFCCVNRVGFVWGDVYYRGESIYPEPLELEIRPELIPRDIGYTIEPFILTIDGRVLSLWYETPVDREYATDLAKRPGPFSEMATTSFSVVAIDSGGTWWQRRGSWTRVFSNKPIWPGTLSMSCRDYVAALSECGHYMYYVGETYGLNGFEDNLIAAIEIPQFANRPALTRVDNFVVNKSTIHYRPRVIFACIQINGCCNVLIVAPERGAVTRSLVLDVDMTIVAIDVTTQDTVDGQISINFKLVGACGNVASGNCSFPGSDEQVELQYSKKPHSLVDVRWLEDSLPESAFAFSVTDRGDIHAKGDIDSADPSLAGCGLAAPATGIDARIDLPPVTRFSLSISGTMALCFAPGAV